MRRDDIRALHEQRKGLHTEMLAATVAAEEAGRDLTAEEKGKFDAQLTEFEELRSRAERAESLFAQEQEIDKAIHTPLEQRSGDGDDGVPETLGEYRKKVSGPDPWDLPEVRHAYWRYLTVQHVSELDVEEQRALSKATSAAGAYLVPTDFYNQIINIVRFTGPINQLANVITTSSGDTIQVPQVTSHGVATWTAENAAYTASDDVFGQVNLNAFKAGTSIVVSEELLTDSSFGLDGYLAQEFGERIGVLEETAYAVGDGSGKPLGIAAATSGVPVVTAAVGNTTSYSYTALVTAVFALPAQYRRNAVFVVADGGARNLYLMLDSQNRPLWNINGVAGAGPDTFLGYPIYTSPDLAVPAVSSKDMIFGDIHRGYIIRRVNGFSLQRQSELYSNNGQVGFRGFERVDGRVVLADAMRILAHSAT